MKIETKGGLWRCTLSSGARSDYSENVVVVSANSIDEAKNSINIWAIDHYVKLKVVGEEYYGVKGLKFNDGEKYQFYPSDNMDWDTSRGDVKNVQIERLDIVYTGNEIAPPNLLI